MTPEEKAEQRRLDEKLRRLFEDRPPEEAELYRLDDKLLCRLINKQERAVAAWRRGDMSYKDIALAAAEEGDYGPLRGLIAKLDERFIKHVNPPKGWWPKGKHRKPLLNKQQDWGDKDDEDYLFRKRAAWDDTKRIRAIWRDEDEIEKRPRGRAAQTRCGHIAEWYAARIWGLSLGAPGLSDDEAKRVVKSGRPSGPGGPKKKRPSRAS